MTAKSTSDCYAEVAHLFQRERQRQMALLIAAGKYSPELAEGPATELTKHVMAVTWKRAGESLPVFLDLARSRGTSDLTLVEGENE